MATLTKGQWNAIIISGILLAFGAFLAGFIAFFHMLGQREIAEQKRSQTILRNAQPHDGATIQKLDINGTDPHICEKRPDVYYELRGPAIPAPAGSGQRKNPVFIFDQNHNDGKVNWGAKFKGVTIPVCLVVTEKGDVTDFHFYKPFDDDLERHMKQYASGWKFKPGTITTSWVDRDPKAIAVQLAFDIVIE